MLNRKKMMTKRISIPEFTFNKTKIKLTNAQFEEMLMQIEGYMPRKLDRNYLKRLIVDQQQYEEFTSDPTSNLMLERSIDNVKSWLKDFMFELNTIEEFYQETLQAKVKEFVELQLQYIAKEANSKKENWDMISSMDPNIKKVDIVHKDCVNDLSVTMTLPITDQKLSIDKNGNIDYASFNRIEFNLKQDKAHHSGAFIVSKEEKRISV